MANRESRTIRFTLEITTVKPIRPIRRQIRGNPFLREKRHDPYRDREKRHEAMRCPRCGVTYRNGRWVWPKTETAALRSETCPACCRVIDRYPAGELLLAGAFLEKHHDEIIAMIRRIGHEESIEHPLHRIMAIDEQGDTILITTTDIHLPHRLAHALIDAWGGSMSTHYDLEGYYARASWERDD